MITKICLLRTKTFWRILSICQQYRHFTSIICLSKPFFFTIDKNIILFLRTKKEALPPRFFVFFSVRC